MAQSFPAYKGREPYIFVSYAHADDAVVTPELEWLHEQGFNVWYDEGISPGSLWRDEIAQSIENASLFVYFVTPHSIDRPHCQREVNFAVDRQIPLLAVHLQQTVLPGGMGLTLGSIQAILRYQLSDQAYHAKLLDSLNRFLQPGVGVEAGAESSAKVARTTIYGFGGWTVDPQRNELSRDGETKRLEPKISDVLRYLLDHPGEIVSSEELMEAVWPGRSIEPVGVARNIAQIRRALGDDSQHPTFIETISKRGYRTVAPVSRKTTRVDPPPTPTEPEADGRDTAAQDSRRNLWWMAGVTSVLGLAVVGWLYLRPASPASPATPIKTVHAIAVLLFENVSPDGQYDYLADGLGIELTQHLAMVPHLRVASESVSSYYKDHQGDPGFFDAQLNVDYLVSGSVHASGNKLRIAAQLTNARDGYQVWAQTLERNRADLLELQRDLARAIVAELPIVLDDPTLANAIRSGTINAEAYDLFLQARASARERRGKTSLARAEALLAAAIELDPQYFTARNILAFTKLSHAVLPGGSSAQTAVANAIEELEEIERLDLGGTRPYRENQLIDLARLRGDWPRAEALLREQLKQSAPEAYWFTRYAELLLTSGAMAPAIGYLQAAEQMEPLNTEIKDQFAKLYYYTRRNEKSAEKADECLALNPEHSVCMGYKARTLAISGELDRSLAMISGASWDSSSTQCYFRMLAGQSCDPNLQLDPTAPNANAEISMLRGDYDATFRWLNQGIDDRRVWEQFRALAHSWPDDFKADPRWARLLQEIGFTDDWRTEICRRAATLEPYTQVAVDCHLR